MHDMTRKGPGQHPGGAERQPKNQHPGGGSGAHGDGGLEASKNDIDYRVRVREVSDRVRQQNRDILNRLATK